MDTGEAAAATCQASLVRQFRQAKQTSSFRRYGYLGLCRKIHQVAYNSCALVRYRQMAYAPAPSLQPLRGQNKVRKYQHHARLHVLKPAHDVWPA